MPREVPSYCRLCECLCGMLGTVEAGRLVKLRPDEANPHSRGFGCVKGTSMADVLNDPDRVLWPLKRTGGPGEFKRVSWDEALGDVAGRLGTLRRELGPDSIALYSGNPPAFCMSAVLWTKGFQHAIGTPWYYSVNGEDAAARIAATAILYGSPAALPLPDLQRTQFLLVLGANPWVSKLGVVDDPRFQDHFREIVARGGRVVVVDPRRTETAERFEHVSIRPGTDAWLLLSILHVIFEEALEDTPFIERWTTGIGMIKEVAGRWGPERTAAFTGVPPDVARRLARDFAEAPSAAVYGRTGTCTQAFGTLTNVLQDTVNIVTGNVAKPGGWVFGWSPIPIAEMAEKAGLATYDSVRTRVARLPDTFGWLPASALPDEITVPGPGRIRSLVMIGANPVLTAPGGPEMEEALDALDLFVSLDLYQNESNRHAHYILPTTAMYERADAPIQFLDRMLRPSIQVTEAIARPRGEAREEWAILDELARRMGLGGAYSSKALRLLAKLGLRVGPKLLLDALIRTSTAGDRFGLRRGGLSWKRLVERHPHGVVLHETLPICDLAEKIKHADGRIPLADPRIVAELRRLESSPPTDDQEYPFLMIGLREIRSQNSWLHNAPRLMPDSRRQEARLHPADAERLGVRSGDEVTVTSRSGRIIVRVKVSDEIAPGCLAVPHGWGHAGGWTRANAAGGANSNLLASRRPSDLEPLAGMTVLNGIPVRIETLAPAGAAPRA